VTDFEACACPLCDTEASCREWAIRSEVRCLKCGHYSIMHNAARALDELSGAGRAVVTESLRARLGMLHEHAPVPLIMAGDVKTASGRLA